MHAQFRRKIVEMVYEGRDGHIPSAFSIIDLIAILYRNFLKVDPKNPKWTQRDYFFLSKGHGCLALYVVLHAQGFLSDHDLEMFCKPKGILGEHPDSTRVPGVEACTGSLGHGLPIALGTALGLKIKGLPNKVYALLGDGECHEGTVWEAAQVAANLKLSNLTVIVDWNGSASQLMPVDDLPAKWSAFGWDVKVIDGHNEADITNAYKSVQSDHTKPIAIIAKTIKGKGVAMLEGHGKWHHRIPTEDEMQHIIGALS